MPEIEFDPAERIATGAVGVPGRRTFFIQATRGGETLSVLVEKQQVALLAERLEALLNQVAKQFPAAELSSPGTELVGEPVPLFRAVAIGIGFDPARQMVLIELHERPVPDADDDDADPGDEALAEAIAALAGDDPAGEPAGEIREEGPQDEPEGYLARIYITPGQARALAQTGSASVEAGRPPCDLCGFPVDPEGHTCPKLNGHGRH